MTLSVLLLVPLPSLGPADWFPSQAKHNDLVAYVFLILLVPADTFYCEMRCSRSTERRLRFTIFWVFSLLVRYQHCGPRLYTQLFECFDKQCC